MRVLVFGAGAVGGFLGARLASAGHDVVVIARPSMVAAIRSSGLRVVGRSELVTRPRASDSIPPGSGFDVVLLTVKGPALAEAGRAIARSLAEPLLLVAWQNGLGVEVPLAAGLREGGWDHPLRWVVRAVNSYGLTLESPGVVRHAGDGEVLLPDEGPGARVDGARLVAELLRSAQLNVRQVVSFERELWRKALVNAAINPVTADHGVLNGRLLDDPWRGQAVGLLREAQRAAALAGQEFSDAEAEQELWRVVRATAGNRSSMLQDVERGRRTEIDLISGYLLDVADRTGVDLPATRRAVDRIHRRERDRGDPPRSPASDHRD